MESSSLRTPLVSILVPVYNRELFLAACLESACAQTMQDLEVVVVDNASTDRSWEICRDFAARDSRVRIFRNATNLGPVANWQRCFAEAQGLYGKVLFSDDLISPQFLERTAGYLDDPEIGFAFTMAEIGSEPGHGELRYKWKCRTGKVPSACFIRDALHGGDLPVSPGAAIFRLADLRRNLLTSIPSNLSEDFAAHGAGPDLLLYLLTAAQYPAVIHVNEPLAFFRWHANSISYQKLAQLGDCYTQARIWFASQTNESSHLEDALTGAWFSRMKACRRWIRPAEIRRMFLGAAINSPLCDAPCFFSSLRYLYRRKIGSH